MSRYIDIDDLPTGRVEWDDIFDAPSIDIVRCKECKHNPWNTDADYTCIWDDDFADREQTLNDFCSYGEREGE